MLYKNLVINGKEFKLAVNLTGKGAPTQKTEGQIGSIYMDESSDDKKLYKCTGNLGGSYTWVEFDKNADWGTLLNKPFDKINQAELEVVGMESDRQLGIKAIAKSKVTGLNEKLNEIDQSLLGKQPKGDYSTKTELTEGLNTKVNKTGRTPNKILGVDEGGNVVDVDAPSGIVAQEEAPADTDVLWIDTNDETNPSRIVIDPTLKLEGQAADAKATGDALKKLENLVVYVTKTPLETYTADYNSTEIRNAAISNKKVELRYEDVDTNSGDQVYAFETFKNGEAIFRRNVITATEAYRINIFVDHVGNVRFEKTDLDLSKYALKSEIPAKLPNPNALTFTGAANATYDGTKPVSVEIPKGGQPVPAYAITEAERVAKQVQENRTSQTLVLSAMSDWHLSAEGNGETTRQAAQLAAWGLEEIKKRMPIDCELLMGDFTYGAADWTAAMCLRDMTYIHKLIPDNERQIWFRGNHDINYGVSRDRTLTPNELYSHIDANSHNSKVDYANPGGGYCYRDFPRQRVRVIALNTCDVFTERKIPAPGVAAPAEWIGIKQIAWLGDHALDLSGKADPAAWGIVLASHHPINYGYDVFSKVIKMLEDYRDKKSGSVVYAIDGKTQRYDYDFQSVTPGKILCALNGHSHNFRTDYVSSSNTVPKWLLRATVPNIIDGRYNEAATSSNKEFRDLYGEFGPDGSPIYYRKTPGTKDGTSFYITSIDREHGVLSCVCYGAGHDVKLPFKPPTKSYKIANNLIRCKTNNPKTTIEEGTNYTAQITADSGYKLSTAKVLMGGADVTAQVYKAGTIRIPSVTGDVVITVTAVEAPKYTNLIPTSKNKEGTGVYNGKGFKENTYISGGNDGGRNGVVATGWMEIPNAAGYGDIRPQDALDSCVIRLKNIDALETNTNVRFELYNADKSFSSEHKSNFLLPTDQFVSGNARIYKRVDSEKRIIEMLPGPLLREEWAAKRGTSTYFRICSPGITDASIITVNEPID